MEYEDELDRMRNRKRRPAVRQTEIKKQTVSRRYAEHFHCCWHQAEYRYHTGAAKA